MKALFTLFYILKLVFKKSSPKRLDLALKFEKGHKQNRYLFLLSRSGSVVCMSWVRTRLFLLCKSGPIWIRMNLDLFEPICCCLLLQLEQRCIELKNKYLLLFFRFCDVGVVFVL